MKAKYDTTNGYEWNTVMDMADKLFDELHTQKYSSQDIAHIGLRLTHLANFVWMVESREYIIDKLKRGK